MISIKELIKNIKGSDELKKEVEAIKSEKELAEFIKKNDCDTTPDEFRKRILIQDDAIGDIAKIRQEVLFIEEFMNIDLSRYMNYSEQLEVTLKYLYKWKKSTVRDYDEFLHPEKKAARLEKEKARRIKKLRK